MTHPLYRLYQTGPAAKWEAIPADQFHTLSPVPPLASVALSTQSVGKLEDPAEAAAILYENPGWWIDIDCDGAPADAVDVAKWFLNWIKEQGGDPACVELWLSGSKGVHIIVPPAVFVPADQVHKLVPDLHHIVKEMTNSIFRDGMDLRVYNRQGMWRTANVKRTNGQYKVPVTADELLSVVDTESYNALCSAPRETPTYAAPTYCAKIGYVWSTARDKVSINLAKRKQRSVANRAAVEHLKGADLPTLNALLNGAIASIEGWNRTAMQFASMGLALGWSEDDLVSRAAGAIRNHVSDGRYSTPDRRERELRNQYRYQDGNPAYEILIPAVLSLLPKGTPADDLRDLIADVPDHGFSVADLMTGHGNKRRLRSDVEALYEILHRDPRLEGLVSYNEFAQEAWVSDSMSARMDMKQAPTEIGPLTDDHVLAVSHWFAREWRLKVAKDAVWSAVRSLALANTRNPPKERVKALAAAWDGEARLDEWLTTYLNARTCDDDTGDEYAPYVRAVGTKWLISLVARVMDPGAQVDTMLVLSGIQGARKSSALRVVGEAFGHGCHGDSFDIGDKSKDRLLKLRGKVVVEWAEMAGLSKRDVREIKTFLTERNDEYRAPYDKAPRKWPRTAVFAASTNETEMLADETGARRFWVVPIGAMITTAQLARLKADIDQIIGEAAHRYAAGEKWWIDGETEADLQKMTEGRQEAAAVFGQFDQLALSLAEALRDGDRAVSRYCAPITTRDWIPMRDIEKLLVDLRGDQPFNAAEWKQMSSALKRQGWDYGKVGRAKARCYRPGEALYQQLHTAE